MADPRDLIQQLAGLARRKHYTCEDSWYNCPKSEDGSANDDAGTECNCGADKHNAKVDAICAYLAQPEPEGLTDQELRRRFLTWWREEASAMRPLPVHDHVEHARRISEIAWANGAVLARWGRPSIEPVPVSERPWEREGWCDGDGWCWWFDADGSDPCWVFDQPQFVIWTHCLPAHALPLPVPTQQGCTEHP